MQRILVRSQRRSRFSATFSASPALVAQGIEHWFPNLRTRCASVQVTASSDGSDGVSVDRHIPRMTVVTVHDGHAIGSSPQGTERARRTRIVAPAHGAPATTTQDSRQSRSVRPVCFYPVRRSSSRRADPRSSRTAASFWPSRGRFSRKETAISSRLRPPSHADSRKSSTCRRVPSDASSWNRPTTQRVTSPINT